MDNIEANYQAEKLAGTLLIQYYTRMDEKTGDRWIEGNLETLEEYRQRKEPTK